MTFNSRNAQEAEFIGGLRVTIPLELGRVLSKQNPFKTTSQDTYILQDPSIQDRNRKMEEAMDQVKKSMYLKNRLFERVVRDGDEVSMIFVDNTNSSGTEDGSRDHPYNTLAEAFSSPRYAATKYIYTFKGDGTSTGYVGNFVLADDKVLWGSGYDGGYKGIAAPGYPVIDGGGAGNVITLGNADTIMGCQIQNAGNYGIMYTAATRNADIDHNIIQGNKNMAIYLVNSSANACTYNIEDNTITGNNKAAAYSNNIVVSNSGSGSVTLNLLKNYIREPIDDTLDMLASGNGSLTAVIKNNTFDGSGWWSVYAGATNSSALSFTCQDNIFKNVSTQQTIDIVADTNASLTADISRNTFYNAPSTAVNVINYSTKNQTLVTDGNNFDSLLGGSTCLAAWNYSANSNFNWVARDNTCFSSGGPNYFIYFHTHNTNTGTLTASGNNSTCPTMAYGIHLEPNIASVINATVYNNTLKNITNAGINVSGAAKVNLKAYNNIITGNKYGIRITTAADATDIIDLGGGSLGSIGNNSIYGNITYDIYNQKAGLTVKAENNWWGLTLPLASKFSGSVDYDPWLTANPN